MTTTPSNRAPDPGASEHAATGSGALRPGVCVAGYLRGELGTGQHGRLVLAAVREAGLEAGSLIFTETGSRQQYPFEGQSATDLDVNLVVINADQMLRFAATVGPHFFSGRYTIGVWAWELEEFPDRWPEAFALTDEIWTNSEYSRRAVAKITDRPVYAFPPPIVTPPVTVALHRRDLSLPEGFLFLFCFDFLSLTQRKNPEGLVRAFSEAFAPGEGPSLVIKAINGEHRPSDLASLRRLAGSRRDILVMDGYLAHDWHAALMNTCDCYVSLHRSEGFGLTMAEAMALGKPVIATGYSGNLDFMDGETAYLVPWTDGTVPDGCDPYPPGARWAEPDVHAAARTLRHVYEHRAEAAAVGERARLAVAARHGLSARAPFIQKRFRHAQEVLAERHGRREDAKGTAIPGPADAASRAGEDVTTPDPYPATSSVGGRDSPSRLDTLSLAQALTDAEVANRRVIGLTHRLVGALSEQHSLREEIAALRDEVARMRSERDALRGSRALRLAERYVRFRRRLR